MPQSEDDDRRAPVKGAIFACRLSKGGKVWLMTVTRVHKKTCRMIGVENGGRVHAEVTVKLDKDGRLSGPDFRRITVADIKAYVVNPVRQGG